MRGLAIFFVASLIATSPIAQLLTMVASPTSGSESIGDALLDDLTPEKFNDPAAPPANTDERKRTDPYSARPNLNFRMPGPLDHWREGEDIGRTSPAAPLPLVRARDGMQRAQSLLAKQDTVPRADEAQKEVIAHLDELIAELSRECQGGNCQPGQQPPKPDQQAQPKPGKAGSTAGRGTSAARDSTTQLQDAASQPVEKAPVKELAKDLWGHLPERQRQQMLQSFSTEFLPEYELEIEKYYRRLAEEEGENSAE